MPIVIVKLRPSLAANFLASPPQSTALCLSPYNYLFIHLACWPLSTRADFASYATVMIDGAWTLSPSSHVSHACHHGSSKDLNTERRLVGLQDPLQSSHTSTFGKLALIFVFVFVFIFDCDLVFYPKISSILESDVKATKARARAKQMQT